MQKYASWNLYYNSMAHVDLIRNRRFHLIHLFLFVFVFIFVFSKLMQAAGHSNRLIAGAARHRLLRMCAPKLI